MAEAEPDQQPADATPEGRIDQQATPQGVSIAALEADIEALMNNRMSKLDEMLDGLEQLVHKIEGDLDQYEEGNPPQ
jgi:hypothetical protein